jgi:excisionase family DNA binding protein
MMEATTERPMLMRVIEVAQELRLARSHVYQLIQSGQLPAVRIGRSVRVPRSALEAWVQERTSEPRDSSRQ